MKRSNKYKGTIIKNYLFFKKLQIFIKLLKPISNRYQKGLNILAETKDKVQGLQDMLKVKMIDVNKKREEAGVLIDKVGEESAMADEE